MSRRVAHLVNVDSVLDPDGTTKIYTVTGQLFFASSNDLVFQFDYANDPSTVVIDLAQASGTTITGMNNDTEQRHTALAGTFTASH